MFYPLGKSQKNLTVGGVGGGGGGGGGAPPPPPAPLDVRGLIEFEIRGRYQNRN